MTYFTIRCTIWDALVLWVAVSFSVTVNIVGIRFPHGEGKNTHGPENRRKISLLEKNLWRFLYRKIGVFLTL